MASLWERENGTVAVKFRWNGKSRTRTRPDKQSALRLKGRIERTIKAIEAGNDAIPAGVDPIAYLCGDDETVREQATFGAVAERWYAGRLTSKAATTLVNERKRIDRFSRVWGPKHIDDLTTADVQKYINERTAKGTSGKTVKTQEISLLRRILKIEDTGIEWNRLTYPNWQPKREMTGRRALVDPEQLDRLVQTIADYGDSRLTDFCCVAYFTGARRREICALTAADIGPEYVTFTDLKYTQGERTPRRVLIVHPALRAVLDKRAKAYPTGPIFPSPDTITSAFRRAIERTEFAAMPGIGLHAFRVNYVTGLIQNGETIATAQKAIGHKSATTTDRYISATQDQADAAMKRRFQLDSL